MKLLKQCDKDKSIPESSSTQDRRLKRIQKLAATAAVFGMAIGVNIGDVIAGSEQSPTQIIQHSTAPDIKTNRPTATGFKFDDRPTATGFKFDDRPTATGMKIEDRPTVTGIKDRPTATGIKIGHPAATGMKY